MSLRPGQDFKDEARTAQGQYAQPAGQQLQSTGEVCVFNLTDLIQSLHDEEGSIGTEDRTLDILKPYTLAFLKANNGVVTIDPTFWMRSGVTRKGIDFSKRNIGEVNRLSVVSSMMLNKINLLHTVNSSPLQVGVKLSAGARGRTYSEEGERERFITTLPVEYSGPPLKGYSCIHKPSLKGPNIVAAAFSDYDEKELKMEYGTMPGFTDVFLRFDPTCKTASYIATKPREFWTRYGLNPDALVFRNMTLADSTGKQVTVPYMVLPPECVHDVQGDMLKSRGHLGHLNPVCDGGSMSVQFCPIGVKSWAEIEKHPYIVSMAALGEDAKNRLMNTPFNIGIKMHIKWTLDDDTTRDEFNRRMNDLPKFVGFREAPEESVQPPEL